MSYKLNGVIEMGTIRLLLVAPLPGVGRGFFWGCLLLVLKAALLPWCCSFIHTSWYGRMIDNGLRSSDDSD